MMPSWRGTTFALIITVPRRVWRRERPIVSLGGRPLRLRWFPEASGFGKVVGKCGVPCIDYFGGLIDCSIVG